MGAVEKLNQAVARSAVGRWFRLEGSGAEVERRGSKFTVELRAGLATFITMAYIISTNSLILTDTGGTCDCDREKYGATCSSDPDYSVCLQEIKMDFITATCAISCIGCVLMGLVGNLPLALAPGMGLNAYFTYTVVGFHGTGKVSYQNALAAVCIEGIIFFVFSLVGLRQWFARLIPASLKTATAAGIGIYLAFIGLQSSAGIGLITASSSTLVELGGCAPEYRDESRHCKSHHMQGGPTWLGIMGVVVVSTLLLYRVKGAILYGIVLIAAISWPRGTPVTYFPYTATGDDAFNYFKKVVTFHPIKHTLAKFHWSLNSGDVWMALITFLYVDILDCTGTMFSMAKFAGFMNEETQDFEGSALAFLCDSSTIAIGSVFGVSPVSTFIESGAGIAEGGKTGITSVVTGLGFLVALFFAPIFASFPPWATGPALISVGAMMIQNVVNVNWKYVGDAVPAFLTIIMIPFGYSIGYGLIAGIGSYILINMIVYALARVSGGRIVPPNYSEKQPWSGHLSRGRYKAILPPWLRRVLGVKVPEIYNDADTGSMEEELKSQLSSVRHRD
ncbi:hypothetical protein GQ54DRAFT_255222 [Martensiomyces pterosporus]|nr:hypothetical protein GQ54DRAFT_255222 [Martensiomyces pterosporus]